MGFPRLPSLLRLPLSCALITSGKPILYPELPAFLWIGRRVGKEAPKVVPAPGG
jgi:hypothetical protein